MPRMSTPARWSAAAGLTLAVDGARRPEIAQLPAGLPDLPTLFTFMRDAELRFETLRLRLEERKWVATGETVRVHELLLQHPGRARVTTIRPDDGTPTNHDVWLSDGDLVRTYRAGHRLGTSRPPRSRVGGLDDGDLPGTSRAYHPRTSLPANSLVETFVHPAGLCQNVLATGACRVVGSELVAGREAIVVESLHPRTIEMAGDRADHRLSLAVDRETGLVARLEERYGTVLSRLVTATELAPDASIPDGAFALNVPADASAIY
jgi:outer membrane lipoprotein-sorting protein